LETDPTRFDIIMGMLSGSGWLRQKVREALEP
jgi:hypothetical protein